MIKFLSIQRTEVAEPDEPLTLDEIKRWLNVDFDDDNELICGMAIGARKTIEAQTGRPLVPSTVTLDIETSCAEVVQLPYWPASDLTVSELDEDDEVTEISVDDKKYFLRGSGLRITYGGRFAISYAVTPAVPEDLKEAIKMEVAERYQNRGENAGELSKSAKEKIQPHVVQWL